MIPVESQRDWLTDALTSGSWRVEDWIFVMAVKYCHSSADVLRQRGRYIWEIYPKAVGLAISPLWAGVSVGHPY